MALLTLNDGLYTGKPVRREITYTDGNTGKTVSADVYVRQYGIAQARKWMQTGKDDDGQLAAMIADNICDESGAPLFAASDVMHEEAPCNALRICGPCSPSPTSTTPR